MFIESIFENEKDSKEIIKLKDITLKLEGVTDLEKIVAKVVKTIVIKYT
jgi:uncharacterized protein Yka (UPF0111/DUF47 family)